MKKIETIFTHGEGELGIDDDANLYWNGKKVITKGKTTFNWWVNLFIIIASISTLVMAVFTVLNFFCK